MVRSVGITLICTLAACSDGSESPRDAIECVEEIREIPVAIQRDIDILLVVDASPSMADEAAVWETNVARFANVLENIEGGLPNIHIGVVSSDVASRGGVLESAPTTAGCTPPNGSFISDVGYANGERDANYTGSFADALSCIALLPPTGGEIEQPLEAMKRALDDSNPENAGFLRDDAFLMVVFIADEDDCSGGDAFALGEPENRSAWRCFDDGVECDQNTSTIGTKTNCVATAAPATLTPLDDYDQFLRGLKADPNTVIVSAIADVGDAIVGPSKAGLALSPSCNSATTDARPAHRLQGFLDLFPQRSSISTICNEDWSDALILIAEQLSTILIGPICLDPAIDLDADSSGLQHECQVSQLRYANTDMQEETLLFECSTDDPPDEERPCWYIEDTTDECLLYGEDGYLFGVHRGRESLLSGTRIRVRCHLGC